MGTPTGTPPVDPEPTSGVGVRVGTGDGVGKGTKVGTSVAVGNGVKVGHAVAVGGGT